MFDSTLKGILIAFASFAAFAWSDASVKLIEGQISPIESAFFGAVFGTVALPFLRKRKDQWRDVLRTTNRPLWLLRFVSSGMGAIGSVTAFTHLSMAEAFALIFLLPSFVTIMSVVFLKEQVGIKRWSAVIIGFVGVLIILRPGFRELSIGHLGAIIGGLSGALSIVIFRAMGPSEKNISLYGAGVLGTLFLCGLAMIPDFQPPNAEQWLWLAGYGLFAALANVLLMYAAQYAPATVIGPTQYSQMLWAILFGYLIFGDHVDQWMLCGIVLIIGSGMLTLIREKQRHTPLPSSVAADQNVALAITPENQDTDTKA
ncbi:DMT family transporter [Agrobacterium sp. Azo12]|uniref:DMT family transporter n=1 Tax=Agrobacterium sp. Azo12 TaxID=3031129 RepID=UPI0023D82F99|nr:DMT family transporter [Agrobacterium sp. Azo12]MDO5895877.1 DMT family transporter [Agrobacterium sp. Azo12]